MTDIEKHREWVTATLVEIKSGVSHIREKVNTNEEHLFKLNGRLRKAENSVSAIKGVGSLLAVVFGSVFGFLFTKN
jgi:hypothetical protein